jgi:magnesium-transporting ATPase (P-type)
VLAPPVIHGLTAAEAAARLSADGPNAVPAPPPRGLVARIGRQLTDPLVALLIVAAVVTTALGDLPDTAVIVLVITVNTLIGVVQEVRADRAIAALDQLAAPAACWPSPSRSPSRSRTPRGHGDSPPPGSWASATRCAAVPGRRWPHSAVRGCGSC